MKSERGIPMYLTWPEMILGAVAGILRRVSAQFKGRKDTYGAMDMDPWSVDIEGACGEMVVAKHLGVYWNGTVGLVNQADVGSIEVRTSRLKGAHLCLRESDRADAVYVLVTGSAPRFVIRGWIRGSEAKLPEFFDADGTRCRNKRATPLYWVPQSKLRGMAEIGRQLDPDYRQISG